MDNNLSELSKPVAWKLHHHDRYYFEENADVVAIAESFGQAKGDAVYSQEYVSALLAELEAKDKRIAELEEEFSFIMGQNDGMEKELRDKDERIEHLEAKLATPVQSPDDGLDDCRDMWPSDCSDDFDTGYKFGLWRYEQNIRAAGFKIEGED